jgi:predicted alpha/beta superfamily hydrolase
LKILITEKAKILLVVVLLLIFSRALFAQHEIVVGPYYQKDSLHTDLGNPKGNRFEFEMPLSESKIYRGDDATLDTSKPVRKTRKILVYVPAAYINGTKAPILVTLDGPSHFDEICNALDNLTISGKIDRRIPAFILISIQNGGDNAKGSQRGLEYDTMSDRFARFINDEVLPAVFNNNAIKQVYPGISISDNPNNRAVMGCSSGGAAAFTMAWFRPDLFRRVISYSGTFVDQQDDDAPEEKAFPLGASEYHSGLKLIESNERKPLRVFLQVSENDLGANNLSNPARNWVVANKLMSDALYNKGYASRFVISKSSGHCDDKVFNFTIVQTLNWIWKD